MLSIDRGNESKPWRCYLPSSWCIKGRFLYLFSQTKYDVRCHYFVIVSIRCLSFLAKKYNFCDFELGFLDAFDMHLQGGLLSEIDCLSVHLFDVVSAT